MQHLSNAVKFTEQECRTDVAVVDDQVSTANTGTSSSETTIASPEPKLHLSSRFSHVSQDKSQLSSTSLLTGAHGNLQRYLQLANEFYEVRL